METTKTKLRDMVSATDSVPTFVEKFSKIIERNGVTKYTMDAEVSMKVVSKVKTEPHVILYAYISKAKQSGFEGSPTRPFLEKIVEECNSELGAMDVAIKTNYGPGGQLIRAKFS